MSKLKDRDPEDRPGGAIGAPPPSGAPAHSERHIEPIPETGPALLGGPGPWRGAILVATFAAPEATTDHPLRGIRSQLALMGGALAAGDGPTPGEGPAAVAVFDVGAASFGADPFDRVRLRLLLGALIQLIPQSGEVGALLHLGRGCESADCPAGSPWDIPGPGVGSIEPGMICLSGDAAAMIRELFPHLKVTSCAPPLVPSPRRGSTGSTSGSASQGEQALWMLDPRSSTPPASVAKSAAEPGEEAVQAALKLALAGQQAPRSALLRAHQALESAVEQASEGGGGPDLSAALIGLARICAHLGHDADALRHGQRALELLLLQEARPERMDAYGLLGQLSREAGDVDAALDFLGAQVQVATRIGSSADRIRARVERAFGLELGGQLEAARQALSLAAAEPGAPDSDAAVLAQCEAARLETLTGDSRAAGRWLARLPEDDPARPPEVRWRLARARALWLEGQGEAEAERAYARALELIEGDGAAPPLRGHNLSIRDALAAGWLAHLIGRTEAPRRLMDAVERVGRRDFLEAVTSERPAAGLALHAQRGARPTSWETRGAAIARSLPGEVAILELVPVRDQLLGLWITADAVEARPWPLPREEILDLSLRHRGAWAQRGDASALREVLAQASEALLAPAAGWLEGLPPNAPLGLILRGPARGLALHAAPVPGAAGERLIERHPVFYAPDLDTIGARLSAPPTASRGGLVLADPRGDDPLAAEEARRIGALMKDGSTALGAEASASTLQERGRAARVLHLQAPMGPGTQSPWDGLELAPAGPQATPHPSPPRPRLGAVEIAGLSLSAELVSLSSSAAPPPGLPQQSLPDLIPWAFLEAGARAVVAAPSDAAGELGEAMVALHAQLAAGTPRAMALALVQREMLADARRQSATGDELDRTPPGWLSLRLHGDWR